MDTAIRERVRVCLSIALSILPRWAKHDFWRVTEPQHQHAHDAITEAILTRLDSEFEIAMKKKPPEPVYTGTGRHMPGS